MTGGWASLLIMPMKKLLLLFVSLSICALFSAQTLSDGYYRVRNLKTDRYVYVYDNTGSINFTAMTADVGAIQLWKDISRTYSDPASVFYIVGKGQNKSGEYYDIQSQGTGIYEIIRYNVNLYCSGDSIYQMYAEGKYLCDNETSLTADGYMGIDRKGDYRKWIVTPMSVDGSQWFGVTPSLTVGDRHFQPFYADFGFTTVGKDMKVWYVSEVHDDAVVIKQLAGQVSANVPVIIECSGTKAKDNKLDLKHITAACATDNQLKGVYFNNADRPKSTDSRKEYDKKTMRVLGTMNDGRLGYILSTVAADSRTKKQYLAANQSYLPVPAGFPDQIPVMTESEYQILLIQKQREQEIADSLRLVREQEIADSLRRVREQEIADSIRIADSIKAPVLTVGEGKRLLQVYDISGRKVGEFSREEIMKLPAGIYIIDRRKVVI